MIKYVFMDVDDVLYKTKCFFFEQAMKVFPLPEEIAHLTAHELAQQYEYRQVPGWKDNSHYHKWIEEFFRKEDFYYTVPILDNANEKLHNLEKHGIYVFGYLSARPLDVFHVTREKMEDDGFPKAPYFLRPAHILNHSDAVKHKVDVLKKHYPKVLGVVDDNYLLSVYAHELEYEGIHFLFGDEKRPELPSLHKEREGKTIQIFDLMELKHYI